MLFFEGHLRDLTQANMPCIHLSISTHNTVQVQQKEYFLEAYKKLKTRLKKILSFEINVSKIIDMFKIC